MLAKRQPSTATFHQQPFSAPWTLDQTARVGSHQKPKNIGQVQRMLSQSVMKWSPLKNSIALTSKGVSDWNMRRMMMAWMVSSTNTHGSSRLISPYTSRNSWNVKALSMAHSAAIGIGSMAVGWRSCTRVYVFQYTPLQKIGRNVFLQILVATLSSLGPCILPLNEII